MTKAFGVITIGKPKAPLAAGGLLKQDLKQHVLQRKQASISTATGSFQAGTDREGPLQQSKQWETILKRVHPLGQKKLDL